MVNYLHDLEIKFQQEQSLDHIIPTKHQEVYVGSMFNFDLLSPNFCLGM